MDYSKTLLSKLLFDLWSTKIIHFYSGGLKKPHGDYKLIVFYLKVDYYLLTYKTMEILMIYYVILMQHY